MTKQNYGSLRVAIVEDDDELRDAILVPSLRAAGIDASGFADAAQLYRAMLSCAFDIVVLDVNLPGEDGFTVAAYLRSMSPLGIVMLSGRAADEDRIRALQAGADVYLVKPVTMELLSANLHSLGRRLSTVTKRKSSVTDGAADAAWLLSADDWCLLSPDGIDIELTAQERTVLRCLFAASQQTVAREVLIGHLTEKPHEFDPHRLDMLVHRLRRKVKQNTGRSLPLRAVRGQGYVLLPLAAERPQKPHPAHDA